MLAPKGFSQELSLEAYVDGRRVADERQGVLHYTFPMILLAAALTIYGARGVYQAAVNPQMLSSLLAGVWLILTGVGMAVLWLVVLPRRSAAKAAAQYAHHSALYGRTAVHFTQDDMTLEGVHLTRTVTFAKTRLCVETPTLFVIFTDDDAVVMLDKAAFDSADTTAFLRDVFARWYKKKG